MTLAPPAPLLPQPSARRALRATPAWWREAADVAFGAGLVVVVVLWAGGGGIADLRSGAAPALTSLGRLTGLVASLLLLVQVLLMARLPVLERSYGQDELARKHRLVGCWSFALMLGHVVLITVGYATTDGRNPLGELWHLVRTYPGMLLAAAGTLCLVLVAVTSVRAARRRLRYEAWHLLHLYAYLGVGLALPHQLWTGGDFVQAPVATAWWWTTWALTAASVVVFRLGLPVVRNLRHRLVVHSVVDEGPGVFSVRLTGQQLERLPARAGQFFLWRFLDGTGKSRAHPYSLSASPDPTMLRVTVKELGDDSARLRSVRPGTRVLVEGPYGRLTAEQRTRPGVLLLAGGIGITPLRALAEELAEGPGDVVLLHRIGSPAEATFGGELDRLVQEHRLRVHRLVGHRGQGPASWLPASLAERGDADLRRFVPDVAGRDVFVCGPDAWTDAALEALAAAGVPREQIHFERFAW